MRKFILSMFCFSILSLLTSCVTFESTNIIKGNLSWGMSIKELKQNVYIEQIYEDEYCEIIYLPKNSFYENEYDEYLLFQKVESKKYSPGLKLRLLKTEIPYEKTKDFYSLSLSSSNLPSPTEFFNAEIKNSCLYHGITENFLADIFEIFPSKFSYEVQILLTRASHRGLKSLEGIWYTNSTINDKDLATIFSHNNCLWLLIETDCEECKSFGDEDFILSHLYKTISENKSKKRPGPFGTWWGMTKTEIDLIDRYYKSRFLYSSTGYIVEIDSESLFHFLLFRNLLIQYYSYGENELEIIQLHPEKDNYLISKYYGIFDKEQGLVQIICICSKINELEAAIKNNYGEPITKTEGYIQWTTSSNIKVEIIYNENEKYLIYTSPEYEKTRQKIENRIHEEELKEQELKKQQNTYF